MTDTPPVRHAALGGIPLEEKAALLSGLNFWETVPHEEAGIRSLWLADGPYGLRHQSGSHDNLALFESDPATCFPPGVAIGSSWNPATAARLGAALGMEAIAQRVDLVLGPGVNIKRSPLCGRNFEYYSEDPHISGVLGAAFTRALQAEGPGVAVKHFAANNQETNRQTVSAEVDERVLREIYLPAFERVVREAQPATVMASYNKLNGVYAWANRWLLTEVLREEWGFDGVVISDWSSISDRVAALRAGLDLEMPAERGSAGELCAAVDRGLLTEADIDRSVNRIAALAARLRRSAASTDDDAHHALARELAADCAVLLRNEHEVLPLPAGGDVAVIGVFAVQPRFQGGGSAHVRATRVDEPLAEIRAIVDAGGGAVSYSPGFRMDGTPDEQLVVEAEEAARRAAVAVVFAGLGEEQESEGFDRADLELPADQIALIRRGAAAAARTVDVLSNGGIVSLEGWHDEVDGILEAFVLGQGGGQAIAALLFGSENPSGHLAETIPLRLEQHPSWLNFPGEQGKVRYGEGVLVGYRYFTSSGVSVRYPFGYGLSYTTFDTRSLDLVSSGDDSFTARIEVANTGTRAGRHVVQVYVSTDAGPVRRPLRELRGFAKVRLDPGEAATVEIDLPRRSFAYWDVLVGDWVVAAGDYRIEVCSDADTVLTHRTITLAGDRTAGELSLDEPVGLWFDHPDVGARTLDVLGFSAVEVPAEQMAMVRSMTMRQFVRISGLDISPSALEDLMIATQDTLSSPRQDTT